MITLNKRIYNNSLNDYIWVDNKKLAILTVYKVQEDDIEYFVCMNSDGELVLINTEKETYYENSEEVEKAMKEFDKLKSRLKKIEDKIFKYYHY